MVTIGCARLHKRERKEVTLPARGWTLREELRNTDVRVVGGIVMRGAPLSRVIEAAPCLYERCRAEQKIQFTLGTSAVM